MFRFVMITLFISLYVYSGSTSVFAAPNLINYQGTLTDGVGLPIDGQISIEFRLFDAAANGNQLWAETQNVTVQNGTYNVLLGVTPFPADLFSNDSLWLEVVAAGEVLSPRQHLVSVPYALRSAATDCIPGDALICYSGAPTTRSIGACETGLRICNPDGKNFGGCVGEILPDTEVCDDIDNDCNALVDDNAVDATAWYADIDGDGYGDTGSETITCVAPQDFIALPGDCDDSSSYVNPGAIEVCDGFDNDCNSTIDESCGYPPACTLQEQLIYNDCVVNFSGTDFLNCLDFISGAYSLGCSSAISALGSCTYINCPTPTTSCYQTNCPIEYNQAFVSATTECTAGQTQPCGTTDVGECALGTQNCVPGGWWEDECPGGIEPVQEICNDGLDNDCDGTVDFDLQTDVNNCGACDNLCGPGQVCINGTCDLPCVPECSGKTCGDDGCGGTCGTCSVPDICTVNGECCAISNGGVEICDGLDNNCDGTIDEPFLAGGNIFYDGGPNAIDAGTSKGDSCGTGVCLGGTVTCSIDGSSLTCSTLDAASGEICGDSLDNDCDGEVDEDCIDADGDGAFSTTDCDDGDPNNYPGNTEICDGQDNNCSGGADYPGETVNADADGALACFDCNDYDPNNYPGNTEICDGQDNDCSGGADYPGETVDADADGFLACYDCNDNDPDNYPGNIEICDGQDNNCNGQADEGCP